MRSASICGTGLSNLFYLMNSYLVYWPYLLCWLHSRFTIHQPWLTMAAEATFWCDFCFASGKWGRIGIPMTTPVKYTKMFPGGNITLTINKIISWVASTGIADLGARPFSQCICTRVHYHSSRAGEHRGHSADVCWCGYIETGTQIVMWVYRVTRPPSPLSHHLAMSVLYHSSNRLHVFGRDHTAVRKSCLIYIGREHMAAWALSCWFTNIPFALWQSITDLSLACNLLSFSSHVNSFSVIDQLDMLIRRFV